MDDGAPGLSESLDTTRADNTLRKRKRGYIITLVIPVFICVIFVLFCHWRADQSINYLRSNLVDRNVPIDYWGLNPTVRDQLQGENGAKHLLAADLLWKKRDHSIKVFDPPGFPRYGSPLDPDVLLKIRVALHDNNEALKLIDAGRTSDYTRFHIQYDPYNHEHVYALFHTGEAAYYTQLRCLDAQARGESDLAVSYLLDLLRISESLDENPCLDAAEIITIHNDDISESLEDLLGRIDLTVSQIQKLDDAIKERESGLDPAEDVRVEISLGFQRIAIPRHYYKNWYMSLWRAASSGLLTLRELKEFSEAVELFDELPDQPLTDPAWFPVLSKYNSKYHYEISASRSVRILIELHKSAVRLRLGRVALACDRYRQENGAWPDSIDVLSPSIQTDPCSGKLWHIQPNNRGITIYSVGHIFESEKEDIGNGGMTAWSIRFRLLNPEYRGKMPAAGITE